MPHKYLNFLVMLYFTIMIITVVLIYKIVMIGSISLSASSLIIPFWYALADVIAEVYGYKVSRQLIWQGLTCTFIFIFVCFGLVELSSPTNNITSEAYHTIFSKFPQVFIGSMAAVSIGGLVNAYTLTKWKALVSGKYFWLRCVCATILGEAFFVFIAFMIEFVGKLPFNQILHLMIASYVIKIGFAPILALPVSFICTYLKNKEAIDIYDNQGSLTPFNVLMK